MPEDEEFGVPRRSRNDGKTSTGPINIKSGGGNFRMQPTYLENLPSHEGSCKSLGIYLFTLIALSVNNDIW